MADPVFNPNKPYQPAGQAAAPTFDPSRPYQAAQPTLQQRTAETFGFDPTLKRDPVTPFAINQKDEVEFAFPQMVVSAAEALMAPGHILRGGTVTEEDARNTAFMMAGTGRPFGAKVRPAAPTTQQLKTAGSAGFEKAVASGDALPPDAFLDFMVKTDSLLKSKGAPAKRLHDSLRSVWKIMYDQLQDRPLSVQDALIMRRQLGDVMRGVDPKLQSERALALEVQKMLDETVDAATSQGGPLAEARALWSRGMKSQTIEDAMERAKLAASGYENGLRIEFRRILKSKAEMRAFTADERRAMKEVVSGGMSQAALRILAALGFKFDSRGPGNVVGGAIGQGGAYALGNSVAGPTGGFAAMAGAQGISLLAQRAAAASTERAALRARDLAASGGRFPRQSNLARGGNALSRMTPPLIGTGLGQ